MTARAPSLGRGEGRSEAGLAFFTCGEAASSLPSPSGKGDRAAVDRVLSYIAYLRRSPSLFFIPLEPYPARFARHLPHAGKVDRAAVDRVLSYIVDLRRFSHFARRKVLNEL